jgi:glycosyltransferase involved in cell wall biosynthesis
MQSPILGIVVPCFNETEVFPCTLHELQVLRSTLVSELRISEKSFLFFVDDGSQDATWPMIEAACAAQPALVRGLKLARNYGHQNALLAGLMAQIGKADAVVSLDADLQDDISAVGSMVEFFVKKNADIVFAVRRTRKNDSRFKRATAAWFYRLLRFLGVDIVPEHGDFRLMSDQALRTLAQFGEFNIFLRGLVLQFGLRKEYVYFDRLPRAAGESKYNLPKMIGLAIDGITSFSIRPLRIITVMGFLLVAMFAVMAIWTFVRWMTGDTVQGWTSLMLLFLLISSFQTLALARIMHHAARFCALAADARATAPTD